ncbi:MAG: alpha-L-arabinofuranosidase C-terminal domain-containing protein [Xanthomonadales bacterium]|jgi:alpha-N-arabinofuranosidase|nr:alpha-L-arabinofuranosidase C-terminal domain-containing protein [Xanthomonadales bacterium]
MNRNIKLASLAASITLLTGLSNPALADTLELTIQADQPGDTISRYLYGQFAEHLGRGIYEGIWVGEDSEIPNTNGFRDDVVAALKHLQIPVIRWPGGCFADEYNWRDGIGPREQRPVRINTHWGWVDETNAFGTHEFFELVEMLGSEAYVAGNIGSATPREMAQWLEYITADGNTELANLRRANGREEPWKVQFWGVGNETWGCGGHMTPEYYTDLYKRYATFLKAPQGNQPKRVASGGSDHRTDWTEALASGVRRGIDGISHHYYTLPTGNWPKKGHSTGFPEQEWISTLHNTMKIDAHLSVNEAVLDKHDPEGRVGLYLDEWGTWYDPEEGHEPGFLYQQNSLRDAVVAALNFNIFHQHTRRLHMANIAQTVNVLQAVVLTEGEKMILTPTYHAFEMYRPFQDARFIPLSLGKVPDYTLGDVSVPTVSASAARTADGQLVLALVNLDPADAMTIDVRIDGFDAETAVGRMLTAAAMDAHNTFDEPENVTPTGIEVVLDAGTLKLELPAKSVTVIKIR